MMPIRTNRTIVILDKRANILDYVAICESSVKTKSETCKLKPAKGETNMYDKVPTMVINARKCVTNESAAKRNCIKKEAIEYFLSRGDLFGTHNPKESSIWIVCGATDEMCIAIEKRGWTERIIEAFGWVAVGFGFVALTKYGWFIAAGIIFGVWNVFVTRWQPIEVKPKETKYVSANDSGSGGLVGWGCPNSASKPDFDWMFGKMD